MFSERDYHWMKEAQHEATLAKEKNEVPVGAVLVLNDEVIGRGHNQSISTNDPTAHAEIVALREAANKIGNYRLTDATLYVTLEPCLMCAGAMVHARIDHLIFGARDPKTGAIVSVENALDKPFLNHRVKHVGGLLALECGAMLSDFFRERR